MDGQQAPDMGAKARIVGAGRLQVRGARRRRKRHRAIEQRAQAAMAAAIHGERQVSSMPHAGHGCPIVTNTLPASWCTNTLLVSCKRGDRRRRLTARAHTAGMRQSAAESRWTTPH
ncbi:MAG: hypothetical protein U0P30_16650 [Vicinamibacterales bacterium]